jgi:hypothetical protein
MTSKASWDELLIADICLRLSVIGYAQMTFSVGILMPVAGAVMVMTTKASAVLKSIRN